MKDLNYKHATQPWVVICPSGVTPVIVQRFKRRGTAEDYVQFMRRLNPTRTYQVVWFQGLSKD